MNAPTCRKCSADMEDGFVIDHTDGARMPPQWVEGKPIWNAASSGCAGVVPVVSIRS